MTNLFDYAEALIAKATAVETGGKNSKSKWFDQMLRLVKMTCAEQLMFTSDDVADRHEMLPAGDRYTTHDKRAFGAVMLQAARNGWCEKTNTTRDSTRKSLHASPRAIWRSKLYVR